MKKIKVAIWGLGRAGWGMHTHEIDRCPGCYEIAGCYDILPERMAQMQKKYPACKAYSSPRRCWPTRRLNSSPLRYVRATM